VEFFRFSQFCHPINAERALTSRKDTKFYLAWFMVLCRQAGAYQFQHRDFRVAIEPHRQNCPADASTYITDRNLIAIHLHDVSLDENRVTPSQDKRSAGKH
jgi:hypothetical protein